MRASVGKDGLRDPIKSQREMSCRLSNTSEIAVLDIKAGKMSGEKTKTEGRNQSDRTELLTERI